jgi:cyclic beta-1,2-glucan synthetase
VVGGLPAERCCARPLRGRIFRRFAKIVRQDGTITTTLELTVASEYDAEVRRVSIANHGGQDREIELTSYAEIVLAPHAADDEHPAYSKLFVETEFVADAGAILATRRRGSPENTQIWVAHLAVVEGETLGDRQFETDRARFLGRGRGVRTPIAMADGATLSNTVGAVLDPVFSLRRQMRIPPGTTARIEFWTLVAPSRDELLALVGKHRGAMAFDHTTALARTQAQVQLRHLGIDVDDAHLFQSLANRVLYAEPTIGRHPRSSNRAVGPYPCFGPTASPATCRSSCSASMQPVTWRLSGNCYMPTCIGD